MAFIHANKGVKNLWKGIAVACLPFAIASCTVSEPDAFKNDGNGTSGRLESISLYYMQVFYMKYDGQGRVTEVAFPEGDMKILVSYNPLEIVTEEYDYYWNESAGKDEYLLSERTEWTNVSTNADGYVTGFTANETTYHRISGFDPYTGEYRETLEPEYDTYSHTLRYDSEGHLIFISDADNERDSYFTWRNGLLVSSNSTDEATYDYEYSDLDNATLQWTPFWGGLSLYQMTGLFGKAPSKMISKITETESYGSTSVSRFSYKLNSIGQISSMKYNDEYGETMTLTFNYK